MFVDNFGDQTGIACVPENERYTGIYRVAMAPRQIVQHDNIIAALAQEFDRHAADVSASAGDQYLHKEQRAAGASPPTRPDEPIGSLGRHHRFGSQGINVHLLLA
jgi:hypothetical protein